MARQTKASDRKNASPIGMMKLGISLSEIFRPFMESKFDWPRQISFLKHFVKILIFTQVDIRSGRRIIKIAQLIRPIGKIVIFTGNQVLWKAADFIEGVTC